jgi:hypothetical protein
VLDLEIGLLIALAVGMALGCWSIYSVRAGRSAALGQGLFVAVLVLITGCTLLAALWQSEALIPLGLSAGGLVVAMLWEAPGSTRSRDLLSEPEA